MCASSVSRSNGTARLTVSDQGPGVPERERERIWEPYYRGTDEAARAVGGSGIGLSLVREIAGSFGGTRDRGGGTGWRRRVQRHHPGGERGPT